MTEPKQPQPGVALHVLLTIAIGLGAWNLSKTYQLSVDQAKFQERLELTLKLLQDNRWSFADQALWSSELQRRNTNLIVPNPVFSRTVP